MEQKQQLEQDIQQLQQAKQQAAEQLKNWQARLLKTEGAIEFTQLQLKRLEAVLTDQPAEKE
jgi:hypothetical protein